MSNNLILVDRSRSTCDWQCPRRRYWNYDYNDIGIAPISAALELQMGIIIHDSLARIATEWQLAGTADIDTVAHAAYQEMFTFLTKGEPSEPKLLFAKEQATLVEGLLRGFYKHQWPRLMAQYPKILAIEQEMSYPYGRILYMSRPDLIAVDKNGEVTYIEYKSTSSKREEWITSWETAIQLHSTTRAIEHVLHEKIGHIVVQGLYKGYCLAPETPVITSDLRWVEVQTLNVGDKLMAFEEYPSVLPTNHSKCGTRKRRRQWQEAIVTKTGVAILPCYKLLFEDGSTIICSAKHKWLTCWRSDGSGAANWTATEDLVPWKNNFEKGHRVLKVVEPKKTALGLSFRDNYDLGYLSAAFDGEGHLSQTKGKSGYWQTWAAFYQNPNVMLSKVCSLLSNYSIRYSKRIPKTKGRVSQLQVSDRLDVLRLLTLTRPVRLLEKFTPNHLGGMMPCKTPPKLIAKEFIGLHEVITLETSTGTLVANGFASHNSSYGKQGSIFCYAYKRNGNPPFSQDSVSYEYKAGFKRFPIWELEGGLKQWVENMPEDVLSEQFPVTPPIFVNDDQVEAFFAQRNVREQEIDIAKGLLRFTDDKETHRLVLNTSFPQRFDACSPAWGKPCPYKRICFGEVSDPLTSGFEPRQPHHAIEDAFYE